MKLEIKRVSVLRTATVITLCYLVGAICFLPLITLAAYGSALNDINPIPEMARYIARYIGFVCMYVIALFVFNCIGAVIYNFVANIIGGVGVDVKDHSAEFERAKAIVERANTAALASSSNYVTDLSK
jgi:hypothetical protein